MVQLQFITLVVEAVEAQEIQVTQGQVHQADKVVEEMEQVEKQIHLLLDKTVQPIEVVVEEETVELLTLVLQLSQVQRVEKE